MNNTTISRETVESIRETLEDMVGYLTQEAYESGELVSGETVYKVIACMAEAKLAEFNGELSM